MPSPAIEIENLTKKYGNVVALNHLNFTVDTGDVVGFLGPNGAGKTTTLRLLLGLIKPTNGRAQIFGHDCQKKPREVHQRLAYVGGDVALWPSLTGLETLYLLGRLHGSVDEAYRDELIHLFELDTSKKVRTYSKGNRQKVVLIAALMVRPDLLVLDEPTIGLDPLMEHQFRHCILAARERGQTVFLSSHIMSEVEATCDRVGILRDGCLVEQGTLADLRHLSALIVEATFESDAPDVSHVAGVSDLDRSGSRLQCHVRGSIEPLLRALSASGVRELFSREPSLEELFLAQYGHSVTGVSE